MANVKLSVAEIELMNNASLILTKNKIIEAIYQLFGDLSIKYRTATNVSNLLPEKFVQIAPKIARGENYEQLPWVMLDYPRYFTSNEILAIRSFFWWGNFCSITLHLKGEWTAAVKSTLTKPEIIQQLEKDQWLLCCNKESEWEHHDRSSNYTPINKLSVQKIEQLPYLKLSKKIPLQEWDGIEQFFCTNFSILLQLLTTQTVK